MRLVLRRDDAAFMMRLERADPGGVVGVVMRDEDIREPPAGLFQRGLHRLRFRGIDRGGRAAFRVMQEHAEIVLETGEQVGLRCHASSDPPVAKSSAFGGMGATAA